MSKCAQHRMVSILSVEGQPLCYACIVCALYAETDTSLLSAWLGRSAKALGLVAHKYGIHKSAQYFATHTCGRIQPGAIPPNKGVRRPGWAPGRMAATQFKPGVRTGIAARNWRPVGTIRSDFEGYLRIKVREGKKGEAYGFGNTRIWPLLSRHVWEQNYGPIPTGHAVVFKDRDRANCAPNNLELITRAELMRRNSIHRLPKDLAEVIQLNGALKRVIRRICEKQNVRSAKPSLRDARIA